MEASAVLQERDAQTDILLKVGVDIAALLDAASQVGLVQVGERAALVRNRALQLVLVAPDAMHGVNCVVDGGAAAGGDLGTDGEDWGGY